MFETDQQSLKAVIKSADFHKWIQPIQEELDSILTNGLSVDRWCWVVDKENQPWTAVHRIKQDTSVVIFR